MGSQLLRPTTAKRETGEWLIQGPWGRTEVPSDDQGQPLRTASAAN